MFQKHQGIENELFFFYSINSGLKLYAYVYHIW